MAVKFCSNCGSPLTDAHCSNCGAIASAQPTIGQADDYPARLADWLHDGLIGTPHVQAILRPAPNTLDVQSDRIPMWAQALAILMFPIGLLFLLAKTTLTCRVVTSVDPAGGPQLHMHGKAHPAVNRRLRSLHRQLMPGQPSQ
jgi:hypothetical protein